MMIINNRQQPLWALILLLSLGITWGSGFAIAKYATLNGITPLGYAFWQSLGPALVMTVIALVTKDPLGLSLSHWRYYLGCGLIGIAIPNTNMYWVAPLLPVGLLAVLVNTAPILTYVLALIFRLERFQTWRFVGVLCGLAGVFCILLPQINLANKAMAVHIVQAMLSPFCFALGAVFIKRYYPVNSSALSLATGMLWCSALILTPLVLAKHAFYPIFPLKNSADVLLLVEIALSSLGYVIMFTLLKQAGPVYYSLVSGVVVITGLFWGGKIFAEHLHLSEVIAIVLIFIGVGLITALFQQKG
jgi:drug/metabolite transporter (DMT)-like permease